MGRALLFMSQYNEAISQFRAVLEIDSNNREVMADLATALSMVELKKRMEVYNRTLSHDPNNIDALLGKGHIFLRTANLESARKHIEQAISVDSSRPIAWLMRAQLLQRQGNLDEARLSADHAIAIKVESVGYWKIGADVLEARGDQALANLYLNRASYLETGKVEAIARPLNGELPDVSEEAAALADFIKKRPEYVNAIQDRAVIYESLGRYDRASYYLGIYLKIMQPEPEAASEKPVATGPQVSVTGQTAEAVSLTTAAQPATPAEIACKFCGIKNDADALFCKGCGLQVKKQEQEAALAVSDAPEPGVTAPEKTQESTPVEKPKEELPPPPPRRPGLVVTSSKRTQESPPAEDVTSPQTTATDSVVKSQLEATQREIDTRKSNISKLEVRYKVGELSEEQYSEAVKKQQAKIEELVKILEELKGKM